MKKLLITIFVLIVSFFVGIGFVNFKSFSQPIEELILAKTGYIVRIKGRINISLLMSPSLVIHDLEIDTPQKPGTLLTKIDKVFIKVGFMKLLKKQIELQHVDCHVESIRINDDYTLKNISIHGALETFNGPLNAKMSFDILDYNINGQLIITTFAEAKTPARLTFNVESKQGVKASMNFDGNIDLETKRLTGKICGQEILFPMTLNIPGRIIDFSKPGVLSCTVDATPDNIKLQGFSFSFEKLRLTGDLEYKNLYLQTSLAFYDGANLIKTEKKIQFGKNDTINGEFAILTKQADYFAKWFNINQPDLISGKFEVMSKLNLKDGKISFQNINIASKGFKSTGYATVLLTTGAIDSQIQTQIFNGQIQTKIKLDKNHLYTTCDIKNIDLGRISELSSTPMKTGLLSAHGEIESFIGMPNPLATLTGPLHFELSHVTLETFDIKALINELKRAKGIEAIRNISQILKTKAQTPIQSISADFTFKDGIANTQNLLVNQEDINIRLNGIIDFIAQDLKTQALIELKTLKGWPAIPVSLKGPFANIDYSVDQNVLGPLILKAMTNMVQTQAQDMAKNTLQKTAKNILGDQAAALMGKTSDQPANTNAPAANGEAQIKQNVGKLVKGLFGG